MWTRTNRVVWASSCCTVLMWTWLAQAQAEALGSGQAVEAMGVAKQAIALAGPLGIDPLLAIALFGVAGAMDLWTPPPGLGFMTETWVWLTVGGLAAFLKLGRSFKLTKPVAEALGVVESVGGLGFLMVGMGSVVTQTAKVASAGVIDGSLLVMAGVCTVASLMILRTALDILIWLSPFPLVDLFFQLVKGVTVVGLVLLAVFLPSVAIVINLLILFITALLVRWATRIARWGLVVIYDMTIGRFSRDDQLLCPQGPDGPIGPFYVFVLDAGDLPKRTSAQLEIVDGVCKLHKERALRAPIEVELGRASNGIYARTWTGTLVQLEAGRVLLPPRYSDMIEALVEDTGAELKRDGSPVVFVRGLLNLDPA